MPRRKQDCPKRMKWEEEALAAAAREAAISGGVLELAKSDYLTGNDIDPDQDNTEDSPSPSSSSEQVARDEDEEDDENTRTKLKVIKLRTESPDHRNSAGSSPTQSPKVSMGDVSMVSSAANIQALLAASAAFPGLLSPGSAAGLLAMPGALPLAMQGLSFVNPLLSLSPTVHPLASKLPGNVLSPPAGTTASPSGRNEGSIIDFSTKGKSYKDSETLVEKSTEDEPPSRPRLAGDSPLDLSTVRKRERPHDSSPAGPAEKKRLESLGQSAFWPAGLMSSALLKSQEMQVWNGHVKLENKNVLGPPPPPPPTGPSDASKALERMTELSKLTGERPSANAASGGGGGGSGGGGRQSAWQSHWLSKGADTAKDVLKCVWCKQSFETLAALTSHMKESKHCGVNASLIHGSVNSPLTAVSSQSSSSPTMSALQTQMAQQSNHTSTPSRQNMQSSGNNDTFLKETVQLPRKLVRGQDVWLGKGAEQTRQILKCMWCGQSFRSLAEMTTHMQQTQHYTNIISQEQIISWKAADDKTAQNHVNAVLTCKVCDQAFSSLKELSSHMVKNSHYKEHIMRSISESGGRRRQARDKRKKALPVRKLLELERAQQEARRESGSTGQQSGRITCEKCGDKIDTTIFVEHIRACLGSSRNSKNNTPSPAVKTENVNGSSKSSSETCGKDKATTPSPGAGSANDPPANSEGSPSVLNAIEKLIEKSFDTHAKRGGNAVGSNILRRLGIDESMDYTKPLMDPMTVNMLRLYGYQRERSASEASSTSERVSHGENQLNGGDSFQRDSGKSTPRSKFDPQLSESRAESEDGHEDSLKIKRENDSGDSQSGQSSPTMLSDKVSEGNRRSRRDASTPVDEQEAKIEPTEAASPCPSSVSERSLRSATPASSFDRKVSSPDDAARRSQSQTPDTRSHSLNALSSMFEGLSSTSSNTAGTSSNPLAALQKLCDKTETSHAPRPNSISGSNAASSSSAGPGAILAFSWACNDAITTDSIMKCAFCDTQFISKGAYRHHLSKMHFVKDLLPTKGPNQAGKSAGPSPQPPASNFEESPHSKFLKYTELAKQLSSKYV